MIFVSWHKIKCIKQYENETSACKETIMDNTILSLFEKRLRDLPDSVCVLDETRKLTARELDRLSDTIAQMLPHGAKRVGIIMDHSVEMIAAVFAVLKAGAAYVPAEPTFPIERINYMLSDADAECVIVNKTYSDRVKNVPLIFVEQGMKIEMDDTFVPAAIQDDDLAYILYTSGSTGKPKGIAVEHRNVCHYVRAFANEFHPDKNDTMLQHSVCSFDIFVEEVFASILSGATLAIPSAQTKNDLQKLMRFVEKNNVTIISGFPYLFKEMNELSVLPKSLRLLVSGGDVLRYHYIDTLLNTLPVYNTYGPSETTVCATYFRCEKSSVLADGTFPIGKPILGAEIRIMDENRNSVKSGVAGEICILGGGIARGYIGNLPSENKAFSMTDDGKRIYYSGDLGYLLPDGNIAFLHRKDTQVMIYGKRVEPMEVENVLLKCKGVKAGCVRAAKDESDLSYLTAYIVADETFSLKSVKSEMKRYLADFMIPEFFIRMDRITLNANGKIDTKALPKPLKETV